MDNFYDRIIKKFGGYGSGLINPIVAKEFSDGNPEEIFRQQVIGLGRGKKALDVGCGDARFAISVAQNFSEIFGIDTSKEMLEVAKSLLEAYEMPNISVVYDNAQKTKFTDASFDMVYCRRGPTYFEEFFRVLSHDGYFIEIGIGEKDAQPLKEIFGRGQGYKKWEEQTTQLQKDCDALKQVGFEVVFAKDYFYTEFYQSYADLDMFLQGVPIFEDYGSEKDKELLTSYVAQNRSEKGILLPRHRIVLVGKKP